MVGNGRRLNLCSACRCKQMLLSACNQMKLKNIIDASCAPINITLPTTRAELKLTRAELIFVSVSLSSHGRSLLATGTKKKFFSISYDNIKNKT